MDNTQGLKRNQTNGMLIDTDNTPDKLFLSPKSLSGSRSVAAFGGARIKRQSVVHGGADIQKIATDAQEYQNFTIDNELQTTQKGNNETRSRVGNLLMQNDNRLLNRSEIRMNNEA
jgi:hypothetical protein